MFNTQTKSTVEDKQFNLAYSYKFSRIIFLLNTEKFFSFKINIINY